MSLKPWREIAVPHEDVLKGTFQQAEFAADISKVHQGIATPEYRDAALFFQRTFITEGMRLLLDSVVKRLAGKGGDPVVQLQTAFGGGKTHTLLAVYHLAKGATPASKMQGIPPILDAAGITELPKARVAVLDGVDLLDLASKPRVHGKTTVKTIWGEMAWQLGGEAAFAKLAEADRDGTAPGKSVLADVIGGSAPCIILMDELVRYVSQFEEGKSLSGGTYDTQLSFIQSLTEALKAVPNAILLASLPFSDREAGSQQGVKALRALEHYFGRVQALWKPVATEEAFEIVRRRLFADVTDRLAAEDVCRAYADYYTANAGDFPPETQESGYLERLKHAYPIHPEVFDRLYEDWSSLDNFQRTRGVLKLMAKVIHRLWTTGNNDLMIQPGSLPLFDSDTRNEAIYYLPQGWDPVLERDIDGERAATTELDNARPLFGSIHACRRIARSVFLGSAPDAGAVGGAKHHRGIELERMLLGCAQPGQVLGHYKDGARALVDRLQYLNSANNRFWFDTRPNLRREMEDRKRRFDLRDDVYPFIKDKLRFANGVFGGTHVFMSSADVPDDWQLRLVVLPPEATFSKGAQSPAIDAATAILKNRGEQPRQKQNRLIFLAPDTDSISRLRDQVTSSLAWKSIVDDVKEGRLNLDGHQTKQASASLDQANDALGRMVRETFKWLLAPLQEAKPGKGIGEIQWDHFQINPAAVNRTEEIEKVLKEHELLITEWSPIHLAKMLQTWFWKDDATAVSALETWQKTCCYLYLPRLREADTLRATIAAGVSSRDFFGIAYGREEGRFQGFNFAQSTTPILDDALLLIEPKAASAFADKLAEEAAERAAAIKEKEAGGSGTGGGSKGDSTVGISTTTTGAGGESSGSGGGSTGAGTGTGTGGGTGGAASTKKTMFFGSVELDPIKAKLQFSDVAEEVLMLFTTHSPFMVPMDRLADVRIVEDVVIEKPGKRPEVKGTKVRSDVLEVNDDTLFPLQGALGYEVTQSLFIGANTWLVEGPSDILYLQVLSQALTKRRRVGLDPKWTLCPSGGIDKITPFVRLFGGNKINVAVLSDIANGDKTKIENLKKADILKAGHFYTCADFTNQVESDVEDLFDADLFVEILNEAYKPPAANAVTKDALMAAAPTPRIVKKAEALFKLMPATVADFDHFGASRWLLENPSVLDVDTPAVMVTLDRFERIFKAF